MFRLLQTRRRYQRPTEPDYDPTRVEYWSRHLADEDYQSPDPLGNRRRVCVWCWGVWVAGAVLVAVAYLLT